MVVWSSLQHDGDGYGRAVAGRRARRGLCVWRRRSLRRGLLARGRGARGSRAALLLHSGNVMQCLQERERSDG